MKRAVLFAVLMMAGCNALNANHRAVLYVRDPSHHCLKSVRVDPIQDWDYILGRVHSGGGRTIYRCDPDGMLIGFNDGDEQP